MSLNGLDDVKVKEAHEAAVAEPGGWFLLKYQSRDEVEILGRGNGGIVEVRNAITEYDEPSPLFGFLRYRRRSVLIKYVPEGCSRLLQARVHVHFNAVTEHFTPHDTVFSITDAKELKDSTLSAACSLHTASGSTSSSTSSLRQRRLMEIEEEEEEETRAKRQSMVQEQQNPRPETAKTTSSAGPEVPLSSHSTETTSPPPLQIKNDLETSPPPPRTSETRSRSPTRSIDGRKNSSQSTRPDLYSYNSYGSNGKPKVKLGPRPSLDTTGRPKSSASTGEHRPVSTLPAGLKLFSRRGSKSSENQQARMSTNLESTPSMTLSPPSIPETDEALSTRPHTSGGRPTTSSGASIKSAKSVFVATNKKDTMTPEKARLLKALQMRKKQQASPPPNQPLPPLPGKALPAVPEPGDEIEAETGPAQVQDALAMLQDMADEDSAIVVNEPHENESDATRTISTPNSPMERSEKAQSTKASSISESTEETVRDDIKLDAHSIKAGPHEQASEITASTMSTISEKDSPVENETSETVNKEFRPSSPQLPELPDHSFTGFELSSFMKADAPFNGEEKAILDNSMIEESTILPESIVVESIEMPDEHIKEETLVTGTKTVEPLTETPVSKMNIPNPEPVQPAPRQLAIPRSKFSVQDLRAENNLPERQVTPVIIAPVEPPPKVHLGQVIGPEQPASPMGSTFSVDSKQSVDESETSGKFKANRKRKGLIEPIRTDISVADKSGHNSEADFSDDDDLMDELQEASVQEAKPVQVSKSPITPYFPKLSPSKVTHENRFSRAFSNPLKKPEGHGPTLRPDSQGGDSVRSVSAGAAYLQRINQQQQTPLLAKKVNIGSSISQRIKALESNLTPESASPPIPSQNASPAFFAVRKASVKTSGSRSPSIADRANSLTRNTPSPSNSRESSPEANKIRSRSGSVANRLNTFNNGSPEQPQKSRPESISVTARIIRDPSQPFPTKPLFGEDPTQYKPLDLKQSPLQIDHQKAVHIAPSAPKETIQERRLSSSNDLTKKERRSSITIVKDLLDSGRQSLSSSRRSMTIDPDMRASTSPGPRSSSRPPSTHQNSPLPQRPSSVQSKRGMSRDNSSQSISPSASDHELTLEKKGNRASRMMRRMSSGLTASRKNLAHALSPTLREEESDTFAPSIAPSATSSMTSANAPYTVAEVGDVNVQFPDTLLWKRRAVRLDSAGYLILSPAQGTTATVATGKSGGGVKRIHLSEFRVPFVPDAEVMEMPNSVVLAFLEDHGQSGELQIACEDRGGQLRVLEVLQEAHETWAACGH